VIHIADATAENLVKAGIKKVGLLGTKVTMEQDFYKKRIFNKYGNEVIVPEQHDRDVVHNVIYNELCLGKIVGSSRDSYLQITNMLFEQGAEAVILSCTEVAMLVQQEHTSVRLFDTTTTLY